MSVLLQLLYVQLFNAGFDKETVARVLPQIHVSNRRAMRLYCPLATVTLAVLTLSAVFVSYMNAYLPCYAAALGGTALSGVLLMLSKRSVGLLNASITLMLFSLLIFGIMVGTVYDPHNTSATFVVLLFAIPLLFCLRPLYALGIVVANISLFSYFCFTYKDPDIIFNDMLNVIPFGIVSFLVSLLMTRVRLRQFFLEEQLTEAKEKERQRNRELEYYCSNDTLTDMGNYFSYLRLEQDFNIIAEGMPTGVLFADLNRLKYINDNFGHLAGNDYIKSFATRLKEAFPDCQCFRLSGDEFLVVGIAQQPDVFLARAEALKKAVNAEPIPVSAIGFICDRTNNLLTLQKAAEQKMYDDKLLFYERFPEYKR